MKAETVFCLTWHCWKKHSPDFFGAAHNRFCLATQVCQISEGLSGCLHIVDAAAVVLMLLWQYWCVGACSNIGAPAVVSVLLHQCGSVGATVAVLVSAAVLLLLRQFAATVAVVPLWQWCRCGSGTTVAVVPLWQFAAAAVVLVLGGGGNGG